MHYIVTLSGATEFIKKMYFANEGDYYEKSYWPLLKEHFPHCEDYWRHFVVPVTRRMEADVTDARQRTLPREHVSEDILELASLHYSMFMHLVCAYDHIMSPRMSSFEDFYSHLGAACTLAEDFLMDTFDLISECTGGAAGVSQLAKREEFLEAAEDHGKIQITRDAPGLASLTGKRHPLDEYMGASEDWKAYKFCAAKVREYRDAIVRNFQIGRIVFAGEMALVPRKELIADYAKWPSVFLAADDPARIKNHFIDMKEQMILDIETIETALNRLWRRPIADMKRLFFDDKNSLLLGKYQITPT